MLDIKKHFTKTVIVYVVVSILMIATDRIYSIFGHGVSSAYMTLMFLYPLLGGAIFFLLFGKLIPKIRGSQYYRVFYNLYNSGIALLTAGSFMKGSFKIAGTDSPFVKYYYGVGILFIIVGVILLFSGKREVAQSNTR